jgi:hypothetical protein
MEFSLLLAETFNFLMYSIKRKYYLSLKYLLKWEKIIKRFKASARLGIKIKGTAL